MPGGRGGGKKNKASRRLTKGGGTNGHLDYYGPHQPTGPLHVHQRDRGRRGPVPRAVEKRKKIRPPEDGREAEEKVKKYTLEDMENFERDNYGFLICPSGDYTEISRFGERCIFGEGCFFGGRCSFGGRCFFGEGCSFGGRCFFGEGCSFGGRCSFGRWCSFGERCRFGEGCRFGAGCSCENGRVFKAIVSFEGAGRERRKTYCFLLEDDTIFVRCGCFSGTESEFIEKVHKTHAGTPHEDVYLSFFDAAKKALHVMAATQKPPEGGGEPGRRNEK